MDSARASLLLDPIGFNYTDPFRLLRYFYLTSVTWMGMTL